MQQGQWGNSHPVNEISFNLRRVQKDCPISYGGNPYSVPSEHVVKDVAVTVLNNLLAAYREGKQIAPHRIFSNKFVLSADCKAVWERASAIFTSSKTFDRWNEVFADVASASAILGRVLHHCTVINNQRRALPAKRAQAGENLQIQIGVNQ